MRAEVPHIVFAQGPTWKMIKIVRTIPVCTIYHVCALQFWADPDGWVLKLTKRFIEVGPKPLNKAWILNESNWVNDLKPGRPLLLIVLQRATSGKNTRDVCIEASPSPCIKHEVTGLYDFYGLPLGPYG